MQRYPINTLGSNLWWEKLVLFLMKLYLGLCKKYYYFFNLWFVINFVFLRVILCKKYNAIIMGKNATINSRNTTKSVSNTKNKSAAVSKQVEGKSFNFNRWQQLLNVVSVLVFSLLAFYILAIKNNQFLIRAQELDLFIPKMFFLRNNMDVPGGLLTWLGSFFSQFFYYPFRGDY